MSVTRNSITQGRAVPPSESERESKPPGQPCRLSMAARHSGALLGAGNREARRRRDRRQELQRVWRTGKSILQVIACCWRNRMRVCQGQTSFVWSRGDCVGTSAPENTVVLVGPPRDGPAHQGALPFGAGMWFCKNGVTLSKTYE
jgi:hypothetical protein